MISARDELLHLVECLSNAECEEALQLLLPLSRPDERSPQREARDGLLAAAKTALALWEKHGLGDDDSESEPVRTALVEAIAKVEQGKK